MLLRSALALLFAVGCSKPLSVTAEDASIPPVAAKATAPVERPVDKVRNAKTLAAAMAIAEPLMDDAPNSLGTGTVLVIAWAVKGMRWSDVAVENNETTHALVMKDADEARGKRMCVPGSLVQIEVVKSDVGKFSEGLILSDGGNLYRFSAVGTSGDLVGNSRARFCGVVTGRYDYSNSAGGTGHAVKLVGMFDLPANH